ncbi:MAG: serine/threonine protein kinase [Polyangiaceae bacterium]|nr:serine/threonine protein kinase [Polyangiaceae bacterium]
MEDSKASWLGQRGLRAADGSVWEGSRSEPPISEEIPSDPVSGSKVGLLPTDGMQKGTMFAGRYRIEQYLARRGGAYVWEAIDLHAPPQESSRVALKVMNACAQPDPRDEERFRRETSVASDFEGPHFVRVLHFGVADGIRYMAFELLEGETLAQHVERARRLSALQCLWLLKQASAALATVHARGVVHRDISPANIFLAAQPGGARPLLKILDFGVAKRVEFDARLTSPGTRIVSSHYMSPEQARCEEHVGPETDLWSIGAVLYRCMTGRRPFDGDPRNLMRAIMKDEPPPPSTIVGGFGAPVDDFFEMALCKDTERRFQSADAMLAAFEAVVAGEPSPPQVDRSQLVLGETAPARRISIDRRS